LPGISDERHSTQKDALMLESTIELLSGLCLGVLTLMIVSCIVGSIVAALRAVSRASALVSTKREVIGFAAEATLWDAPNRDIPTETECLEEMHHG
jgi:hypothetical protein